MILWLFWTSVCGWKSIDKQCIHRSDCSFKSSLIRIYTACQFKKHFVYQRCCKQWVNTLIIKLRENIWKFALVLLQHKLLIWMSKKQIFAFIMSLLVTMSAIWLLNIERSNRKIGFPDKCHLNSYCQCRASWCDKYSEIKTELSLSLDRVEYKLEYFLIIRGHSRLTKMSSKCQLTEFSLVS